MCTYLAIRLVVSSRFVASPLAVYQVKEANGIFIYKKYKHRRRDEDNHCVVPIRIANITNILHREPDGNIAIAVRAKTFLNAATAAVLSAHCFMADIIATTARFVSTRVMSMNIRAIV